MTLNVFTFENGPEGAALTNGTSGSVASSVNAPSTSVFSASAAAHGSFGGRFTAGAANNAYRRWPFAVPTQRFQFSGVVTLPATTPAANTTILSFSNSAGVGRLTLQYEPAGGLVLRDQGGAHFYSLGTSAVFTPGGQYRIAIEAIGGSLTASRVTAQAYSKSGTRFTTPVGTAVNATDANMTTDSIVGTDVGIVTQSAAVYSIGWDDLQLNDGVGNRISDYGSVPLVDAGAHKSALPNTTVSLTGTATTPEGTVASRAWAVVPALSTGTPTLSGATTATVSLVTAGTSPQLYTLEYTVTGSNGGVAKDTVEVRVPAGGSAARPLAFPTTSTPGWIRNGGTSDGGVLADESNTTYLESAPVSAAEQTQRIRLAPRTPMTSTSLEITLSMDVGTGSWAVRLYESGDPVLGSGILRQSWTQAGVGTTATNYTFALSAPTVAAIVDWNDLWIEIGVVA